MQIKNTLLPKIQNLVQSNRYICQAQNAHRIQTRQVSIIHSLFFWLNISKNHCLFHLNQLALSFNPFPYIRNTKNIHLKQAYLTYFHQFFPKSIKCPNTFPAALKINFTSSTERIPIILLKINSGLNATLYTDWTASFIFSLPTGVFITGILWSKSS